MINERICVTDTGLPKIKTLCCWELRQATISNPQGNAARSAVIGLGDALEMKVVR